MGLPAYLNPAQIARANGMRQRTMREKLRRAGILEPDGPVRNDEGQRYHVGQSRLRERLPEIYERVFDFYVIEGNPLCPSSGE